MCGGYLDFLLVDSVFLIPVVVKVGRCSMRLCEGLRRWPSSIIGTTPGVAGSRE